MLPHSFRDLPKLRDSISYLYFERGRLEQTKLGVEFVNKLGRTIIPVANLTALLLGPGTTVTHAAVRSVARTRSEEQTSELQSRENIVCRLLLEKKDQESILSSARN